MKPPEFKTGNASIRTALNTVADYARKHGINPGGRPGWNQTPDGWMPPLMRSVETLPATLWELTAEDTLTGEVSVACGTIIEDASDLTAGLTITDADETFTVAVGEFLYLELTNIDAPVVTLKSGGEWNDYPARYEIEDLGDGPEFVTYFYPLWAFTDMASDDSIVVKVDGGGIPTVFAHRIAENTNLELAFVIYQDPADGPFLVPKFIPSHKVLPA